MKKVTKHASKRIRERLNVRNSKYNFRLARIKGSYNYQYDGDFRKFLDYMAYKNNKLITVLQVPEKYKNLKPIYSK